MYEFKDGMVLIPANDYVEILNQKMISLLVREGMIKLALALFDYHPNSTEDIIIHARNIILISIWNDVDLSVSITETIMRLKDELHNVESERIKVSFDRFVYLAYLNSKS